uniref:O-acyl-ADP-ribose deacylase 1 n=1 Tax=Xiphophorus couchianus TaxID=32473 RepID=A0A3B5LPS2_9TELE
PASKMSSGPQPYVTGDLFSCPRDESLAHCISEDCRMGAGIAVMFKKKFGRLLKSLFWKKCFMFLNFNRALYNLLPVNTEGIFYRSSTFTSL